MDLVDADAPLTCWFRPSPFPQSRKAEKSTHHEPSLNHEVGSAITNSCPNHQQPDLTTSDSLDDARRVNDHSDRDRHELHEPGDLTRKEEEQCDYAHQAEEQCPLSDTDITLPFCGHQCRREGGRQPDSDGAKLLRKQDSAASNHPRHLSVIQRQQQRQQLLPTATQIGRLGGADLQG